MKVLFEHTKNNEEGKKNGTISHRNSAIIILSLLTD